MLLFHAATKPKAADWRVFSKFGKINVNKCQFLCFFQSGFCLLQLAWLGDGRGAIRTVDPLKDFTYGTGT